MHRPALARPLLASLSLLPLLGSACLELPPLPYPDASVDGAAGRPAVLGVRVLDASSRAWSEEEGVPRRPRIQLDLAVPLEGSPEPFLLLRGESDASLLDDLATAPLRAANLAREIPCSRRATGTLVELVPLEPLAPGSTLTIAVAAWARDARGQRLATPFAHTLRIADSPLAGARATATWPPDGAIAIGASLPLAAVRFDGMVDGVDQGLWLEDERGQPVRARAANAACVELGWPDGHCAVVEPGVTLDAGATYALRSSDALVDATGATVPPVLARFTTSLAPDRTPPELLPMTCALDEERLDAGCLLADEHRFELRVRASEPVRLRLEAGERTTSAIAPRGETTLVLSPFAPATLLSGTLVAIDAAGLSTTLSLPLATTERLATLSITEVRADPYGPEPRQEYVEVLNFGDEPVDLRGFALADAPTSAGDVVPTAFLVPPGARILLVAEGFDPDDRGDGGRDAPVPPGVPLVRLDRSLASGGLANGGEPLFLRDALGRRVSAAPAEPPPRPGVCTVRIVDDPRTGARGSFDYDAGGGCTPGR